MKTETKTVTVYEEGDVFFAPQSADPYDSFFAGRLVVAEQTGTPDNDGDILVRLLEDQYTSGYARAECLVPYVADDPDHERVFILDKEGWDALPADAVVIDGNGEEWLLTDELRAYAPDAWDFETYAPFEVSNPEVLAKPAFEFPLEVLEGLGYIAEGTRVRVLKVQDYGRGDLSVLVTSSSDADPQWENGVTVYLHSNDLATAEDAYAPGVVLSGYAASDEVEGPVFVLDVEGLDALPCGTVVAPVGFQAPFLKLRNGNWFGLLSENNQHTADAIELPAEVTTFELYPN